MHIVLEILDIVAPVFLIVGLGFGLKRTRLINGDFLFKLNRLIYYLALPVLLFHNIATANFSLSFNAPLILGSILATVLAFLFGYIFARLCGYSPAQQGAFCQGGFRGNLAFVALAIIANAYGEDGLAIAGIVLGFLIPVLNFLSVIALLLPQQQQKQSLGKSFWASQFVFNPLIIASFLGIVWSFLGFGLTGVVERSLDILAGMALPLALLSIGAAFSPKKLKVDIVKASLAVSIKIVWLPLLAALILIWFGVRGQELGIGVLAAGAPTAAASYIMAQQLHADAELSSGIIMLSTLCSVFTYSITLYLLKLGGV